MRRSRHVEERWLRLLQALNLRRLLLHKELHLLHELSDLLHLSVNGRVALRLLRRIAGELGRMLRRLGLLRLPRLLLRELWTPELGVCCGCGVASCIKGLAGPMSG